MRLVKNVVRGCLVDLKKGKWVKSSKVKIWNFIILKNAALLTNISHISFAYMLMEKKKEKASDMRRVHGYKRGWRMQKRIEFKKRYLK